VCANESINAAVAPYCRLTASASCGVFASLATLHYSWQSSIRSSETRQYTVREASHKFSVPVCHRYGRFFSQRTEQLHNAERAPCVCSRGKSTHSYIVSRKATSVSASHSQADDQSSSQPYTCSVNVVVQIDRLCVYHPSTVRMQHAASLTTRYSTTYH